MKSDDNLSNIHTFSLSQGAHEDNMICNDIAMLGPLMLKQFNKLKVKN